MLLLAALLLSSAQQVVQADPVSFSRDVRPILADKCFYCHGPDAAHRKAELRLDDRAAAVSSGAITPGKPEASALVARIFATDRDEIMPPPAANKHLTPSEKELLRRWIAEGAEYQGHWAFRAPQVTALAEPTPWADREVNPIDRFVFARLAAEKLAPSQPADPITLIRRVSLDLTGIPPTPQEIDAFLADRSADAYERLVDRLLTSPRYGERMAMQWLDYARYADSNGFQTDTSRQMWRWRDWVIEAFNRNLPFDQFTIEQLAGDMLPNATPDQRIATGFHRNMRLNGEGGRIVEEWFAETVIDRVDTTGQTWLALTLGCCRCHDHKYDPLTQQNYYQLFAFFNSIDESGVLDGGRDGNSKPVLVVPTTEQESQRAKLLATYKEHETQVAALQKDLPKLQADWEVQFAATLADASAAWLPLEPRHVASRGGAKLTRLDDGSWLASGTNPPHDEYVITAPLTAGKLSGLRLEVLPDNSLPNQSLGRAPNGNFVLTGVTAEITSPKLAQPRMLSFTRTEADYEQKGYEAKYVLDAKSKKGWAIDGNDPLKRLPRKLMLVAASAVEVPDDATLVVRLRHDAGFANHNIGRFRIAATTLDPALVKLDGIGVAESIRTALKLEPDQRSAAQRAELTKLFREQGDGPYGRAQADLAAAKKQLADFQASLPTTMVMQELPQPRDTFLLKRGEYDKPGEKVGRAVPGVLPPLPAGAPLNRLGLAMWLVSPEHPLTARVWVNRQWERFFGTGLVKTVDNFGLQSEPPSHPELLDWLAMQFSRGVSALGHSSAGSPWDMKALQKLIVMSAVYRQSSHVSIALQERDPENRLLARGPRFRLPAELIRDQALTASGLLVEKVGGPSVRPYMPEGVWDETSKYGDLRGYKADNGDGLYRRTLYTIWKRTAAPPTMLMFDSPSREFCAVKRARTNTPLQALALLNEVTYIETARVLAERMLTEGGSSPNERIAWGFRLTTGRAPDADELTILMRGLVRHLARYQADVDGARKLITQGAKPFDAKLAPQELAAYTLTANVLMNLDEVVTKE
ncbi:MAG: PSD1 domain-containing protein [Planctomycetaceae bacterium]|nr:PSD1 domain-containing protein [Planctomycetaceae bacterium]